MRHEESAPCAARRELAEGSGLSEVTGLYLEQQLRTYSRPGRDPRMRVVPVAFAALLPTPADSGRSNAPSREPKGGGDAAAARRVAYDSVPPPSLDHDRLLAGAHERVCAQLEQTCLATAFCPPEFTLGELRCVYETVWGAALDRPDFRRKALATPGFVEPVPGGARLTGARGEPAALHRAGTATTLHPPLLRPSREGRPACPPPPPRSAPPPGL